MPPGAARGSALAMFVVMPIVAAALVRLFELRLTFEIALVSNLANARCCCRRRRKAGAQSGYGLGSDGGRVCPGDRPLPPSLAALGRHLARPSDAGGGRRQGGRYHDAVAACAGVTVRATAPAIADRLEKPAALVATVPLACGLGALLVAALPVITGPIDARTLLATASFIIAGPATGIPSEAQTPTRDRAGAVHRQPPSGDRVAPWPTSSSRTNRTPVLRSAVLIVLTVMTIPTCRDSAGRRVPRRRHSSPASSRRVEAAANPICRRPGT